MTPGADVPEHPVSYSKYGWGHYPFVTYTVYLSLSHLLVTEPQMHHRVHLVLKISLVFAPCIRSGCCASEKKKDFGVEHTLGWLH